MRTWIEKTMRNLVGHLNRIFSILRVALIAAIIYLLVLIAHDSVASNQIETPSLSASDSSFSVIQPRSEVGAALPRYASTLNHRNIFGQSLPARTRDLKKDDDSENVKALLERYQVVGVMWGNTPKAILLDKSTQTTLTAGVGDKVGDLEVIGIEREFVRFQLLGETYDAKY